MAISPLTVGVWPIMIGLRGGRPAPSCYSSIRSMRRIRSPAIKPANALTMVCGQLIVLLAGFFFLIFIAFTLFYVFIITLYRENVKRFGEISKNFDPRRGLFDSDPAGGGAALGHYAAPGARSDARNLRRAVPLDPFFDAFQPERARELFGRLGGRLSRVKEIDRDTRVWYAISCG